MRGSDECWCVGGGVGGGGGGGGGGKGGGVKGSGSVQLLLLILHWPTAVSTNPCMAG